MKWPSHFKDKKTEIDRGRGADKIGPREGRDWGGEGSPVLEKLHCWREVNFSLA